jgi:hypothetical protein
MLVVTQPGIERETFNFYEIRLLYGIKGINVNIKCRSYLNVLNYCYTG